MKCMIGTFEPGIASRKGGHVYEGISGTLRANPGDNQMTLYAVGIDSYNQAVSEEVMASVRAAGGGDTIPKVLVAYGVVTKGNGDAFINPKTHTALSRGGGEAGQGYPCVLVYGTDMYNQDILEEVEPTLGSNCGISTGRNGVMEVRYEKEQQG